MNNSQTGRFCRSPGLKRGSMMRTQSVDTFLFTVICTAVLAGCGNNAATSPQAATESSSIHSDTEQSSSTPVVGQLAEPQPMAPVVVPRQVDTAEAARLFESLFSPGLQEDQWDLAHAELLKQGEATTIVLAEKLTGGSDAERELAATTLALLGPLAAPAQKELIAALQDSSPFVQANAAATLVQIPDLAEQAIPTLARLLLADDPQLRHLAAVNLNAAGVAPTSELATLRQSLKQENSEEVLTPVVELLGRIGPPAEAALPELQKIASEQSGELGTAANSAIQLISGTATVAPAE